MPLLRFSAFFRHPPRKTFHIVLGSLLLLSIFLFATVQRATAQRLNSINKQQAVIQLQLKAIQRVMPQLKALDTKIKDYQSQGVDVKEAPQQREGIKQLLIKKEYEPAEALIITINALLDNQLAEKQKADQSAEAQKQAEAAKQGTLKGKVTSGGSSLSSVTVSLLSGKTVVTKATTDKNGDYTVTVSAGSYTVTFAKSGYTTETRSGTEIKAQQIATLDVSLTRATSSSTTTSSDSTDGSSYELKSIGTSRGTFSAHVMTFDLGSGKFQVVTDTANESDCSNNCPVLPLKSYSDRNGAFAAINGTYFCPADYGTCDGQINAFFWKVVNSRLAKTINQNNGLGENDAYLKFDSSGKPSWYSKWSSSPGGYAGINSKPTLVSGGQNVLDEGSLDDKQRTTKSNRGALGLKGSTLYGVIARSATIPDLAAVMQALGVDYSINIDGGGSSAMIYNGSYKAGPGRNIPNALMIIKK